MNENIRKISCIKMLVSSHDLRFIEFCYQHLAWALSISLIVHQHPIQNRLLHACMHTLIRSFIRSRTHTHQCVSYVYYQQKHIYRFRGFSFPSKATIFAYNLYILIDEYTGYIDTYKSIYTFSIGVSAPKPIPFIRKWRLNKR